MDAPSYKTVVMLFIALLLTYLYVTQLILKTPKYKRVDEGFFGGIARGSGQPDCLRTLPEAGEILAILIHQKPNPLQSADYKELELILSKMSCLKKDLLSPSGIVEATRYQAFDTNHDRINVADLCALCNSQNISPRDLDISFATWRDRGSVLLRRLCTELNVSQEDLTKVEKLFTASWNDVYNISKSKCLKTDFSQQNGGQTLGDVGGFQPTSLTNLSNYANTNNSSHASGWNGAV